MEIKIFENAEFGKVRINTDEYGKITFCGKDVAEALGYKDTVNAIKSHCKKDGVVFYHLIDNLGRQQEVKFISEGNLYRLIAHSKLPSAEKFENWVFDEVLPSIRKTGGYVNNDDMFINTYLPFADETTKLLFKNTLNVINNQNKLISEQRNEIKRKSDVIQGFADDIPNPAKRKILNEVVRYGGGNCKERWNYLYREFKAVHGIDVSVRYKNYVEKGTRPKMNSKLDYVDKKLNMLDELYGIAVKLYESDIEKIKERYDIVSERDFDYGKKKIKC